LEALHQCHPIRDNNLRQSIFIHQNVPARVDSESAGPSRRCRTVRSLRSVRRLVSLDFPWSCRAVWLFVLGSAVVLELLQIIMADQDAQIIYAVKKPTGGVTDLEAAHVLFVCSSMPINWCRSYLRDSCRTYGVETNGAGSFRQLCS
jgi:hypothetical protein